MARDEEFIPMRLALAEDPRVADICARTKLTRDDVIGKLYRVWAWVRKHTDHGQAKGATTAFIDAMTADGFADAMMQVKWLKRRKGGGLVFPDAAQWIDHDSTYRSAAALRMRAIRLRNRSSTVAQPLRNGSEHVARHPLPSSHPPAPAPSLSPTTPLLSSSPPPVPISPTPGSSEPQNTAASKPSDSPAWCDFETVGKDKTWVFTHAHRAKLAEAFPNVDVSSEARKARAWVMANPSKRKTPRGMAAFLWRWMERCANRGGDSAGGTNGVSHPTAADRRRAEFEKAISEEK